MLSSINSSEMLVAKEPGQLRLESGGRIVVLEKALYNSATQQWHDIRVVRTGWLPWLKSWWGGGGYQISGDQKAVAESIQKAYGASLKTLGAKPGEGQFWSDGKKTQYASVGRQFLTSYPYKYDRSEALLSKEDAAFFGASKMTVHDAIEAGILRVLGVSGENGMLRNSMARREAESDELAGDCEAISSLPKIPSYQEQKTPFEPGYDNAPLKERRRRVIRHLDKSSPIPFSAFVYNNRREQIESELFSKMVGGIRQLTVNPNHSGKDAKYMRNLLMHWFRAAYFYLHKNSNPGDGYAQIEAEELARCRDGNKEAQAAAEARAKERYWRQHATDFWMHMIGLFSRETLNTDELKERIAGKTPLRSWSLFG